MIESTPKIGFGFISPDIDRKNPIAKAIGFFLFYSRWESSMHLWMRDIRLRRVIGASSVLDANRISL